MTAGPAARSLHLRPEPEDDGPREALARRLVAAGGGPVPLTALLDDLGRRGRRTPLRLLPLAGVHRAWTWDATDRRDPRWWPQGVTTDAEAAGAADRPGAVVLVAWYAKERPGDVRGGHGVRVAVLDTSTRRYEHVLLVRARGAGEDAVGSPWRAHAGGLAWVGSWLHVAATRKGFGSFHLDDLLAVPEGPLREAHLGHRYVLPLRVAHRAGAAEGTEPLRYSFFSVGRGSGDRTDDGTDDGYDLLVGEYGRARQTRRLVRFPLDREGLPRLGDDGRAHPTRLADGVAQMQGVVDLDGRLVATASHGPWGPGSVWSGAPGALTERRTALPMGPEDLAHDPRTGLLWSATEHPRRRWVVAMRADRF